MNTQPPFRSTESGAAQAAAPAAGAPAETHPSVQWLEAVIRWSIYVAAFLAPWFYLPFTPDVLFAKVVLVEVAAVVAGTAWLLRALVLQRLGYKRMPVNLALLALALALAAGTLASASPWQSFWGPDQTGEKTASVLAFIVFAFVTAATFERREVERLGAFLLASFSVLGLFSVYSIFAGRLGWRVPAWLAANPVGTLNALAVVLAVGFLFSMWLGLTGAGGAGRRTRFLAAGTAAILFISLVFTGFRFLWFGIAAVAALLIALQFTKGWRRERSNGAAPGAPFSNLALGVVFLVLILALFLAFRPLPAARRVFQPPLEVSPSLLATLQIGRAVLREQPLFGMGPANFRIAYQRFRDASLNSTVFWNARFGHGFSLASTAPATLGALGVVALLGFVALAAGTVARAIWVAPASDPYPWALGAGLLLTLLLWFLYASSFTASFLAFLSLGMIGAIVQESRLSADGAPAVGTERKSWWRVTRRSLTVDAPALNFAVSLAVVFAAAFSLTALYALGAHYAAEVYFRRAAVALNQFGNTDTARVFLERAIVLNPTEESYHRSQAEVSLAAVQRLIAEAAVNPGQDLSDRFRAEFTAGVNAAQRAAVLAPADADPWFALGQFYEIVAPFVPGADRAALDAYDRGSSLDPTNPILPLGKGRVLVSAADLLTLQINQTSSGEARSRLEATRSEAHAQARSALEGAIELKGDFAAAHFLLAQLAIREGNVGEAIRKTEDTARLAPLDVGVAFQLGVLYYRADRLDEAKGEFERAILLNENYSNARYFLGLTWDRKGDRDAALSQFVKIARLNPEHEEVKRIIANLEAGRPALAGIVPPASAPETRREPPVGAEQGKPLDRTVR